SHALSCDEDLPLRALWSGPRPRPQCSTQPCRLRQEAPRRREWPGDSKRTQRGCLVYQRHRCTLPEKPSWQEASRRFRATGEGRHRLFARGGGVSVRVTTAHSIATATSRLAIPGRRPGSLAPVASTGFGRDMGGWEIETRASTAGGT